MRLRCRDAGEMDCAAKRCALYALFHFSSHCARSALSSAGDRASRPQLPCAPVPAVAGALETVAGALRGRRMTAVGPPRRALRQAGPFPQQSGAAAGPPPLPKKLQPPYGELGLSSTEPLDSSLPFYQVRLATAPSPSAQSALPALRALRMPGSPPSTAKLATRYCSAARRAWHASTWRPDMQCSGLCA